MSLSGPAIRYPLCTVRSGAAARARNKLSSRVLTSTLASVRILDTSSAFATALTLTAPEEGPVVLVLSEFRGCRGGASVRLACSVGSTVVAVVLVVDFEDGKGLSGGGTGVVTALCGLDGVAGLCGGAGR